MPIPIGKGALHGVLSVHVCLIVPIVRYRSTVDPLTMEKTPTSKWAETLFHRGIQRNESKRHSLFQIGKRYVPGFGTLRVVLTAIVQRRWQADV